MEHPTPRNYFSISKEVKNLFKWAANPNIHCAEYFSQPTALYLGTNFKSIFNDKKNAINKEFKLSDNTSVHALGLLSIMNQSISVDDYGLSMVYEDKKKSTSFNYTSKGFAITQSYNSYVDGNVSIGGKVRFNQSSDSLIPKQLNLKFRFVPESFPSSLIMSSFKFDFDQQNLLKVPKIQYRLSHFERIGEWFLGGYSIKVKSDEKNKNIYLLDLGAKINMSKVDGSLYLSNKLNLSNPKNDISTSLVFIRNSPFYKWFPYINIKYQYGDKYPFVAIGIKSDV